MAQRKVFNKYSCPDFDPSMLAKLPRPRPNRVRIMLPVSAQCNTCGGYIYKGQRFNACKISANDSADHFKIKCSTCLCVITFETNSQNFACGTFIGATEITQLNQPQTTVYQPLIARSSPSAGTEV
eukprot:TRINITY_DN21026_c0_g1_i1.p1 TRINITY_DN21026_c0_g1~~TRINITY_DN21026_c0_g1_i1.p1  ORF type:complete len:126 (-),score=4.60 TRINITY_DN21026_c0_g1_i1:313-690(-)